MISGSSANAHETEVCLQQVAQAAELLRTCRVLQSTDVQCDANEQTLARYIQRCRSAEFTSEDIQRARVYGESKVSGDPARSPYQRQLTRMQWERSQTDPNLERFVKLFPDQKEFAPSLQEHFATAACPKGYEGMADRWLYTGTAQLTRYNLSETGTNTPAAQEKYFFAPEEAGTCYSVASLKDSANHAVINIPTLMLQSLDTKGQVVRCKDTDCKDERAALQQSYQQYQGAYRNFRQLMMCADAVRRNKSWGFINGILRSASSLPDYCPQQDVEAAYLNARSVVEALDQRLFEQPMVLPEPTKMTQN